MYNDPLYSVEERASDALKDRSYGDNCFTMVRHNLTKHLTASYLLKDAIDLATEMANGKGDNGEHYFQRYCNEIIPAMFSYSDMLPEQERAQYLNEIVKPSLDIISNNITNTSSNPRQAEQATLFYDTLETTLKPAVKEHNGDKLFAAAYAVCNIGFARLLPEEKLVQNINSKDISSRGLMAIYITQNGNSRSDDISKELIKASNKHNKPQKNTQPVSSYIRE